MKLSPFNHHSTTDFTHVRKDITLYTILQSAVNLCGTRLEPKVDRRFTVNTSSFPGGLTNLYKPKFSLFGNTTDANIQLLIVVFTKIKDPGVWISVSLVPTRLENKGKVITAPMLEFQ